jgi:hypothetical protein
MLALLYIAVPFTMIVPLETEFSLYAMDIDGCEVVFDIPKNGGKPIATESPDYVNVSDKPAYIADTLAIRFRKESFDRRISGEIDPPAQTIAAVVTSFLERLRLVARAPQVRGVTFPQCQWHLHYLADDETELPVQEGLLRGRFAAQFNFSYVAVYPDLWNSIHALPHMHEIAPWQTLLIDARGALPHVGTAVVLAATALEVFISEVLKRLAIESEVPDELWAWIADRGDWQKEPSVEEQYSVLLQVLCGHSLKEDNGLWEAFKNLRRARNSFVHEGLAMVGKQVLQIADATALLDKADQVLTKIRDWLPEVHRWPVYDHAVQVQLGKRIGTGSTSAFDTTKPPGTERW